ncbi:hypothetical protein [Sinorhizobium meliloti]|nr:hypothetical protein [Sinorhizobium meliloti]MQW28469.1 hypothetical protein [Sinorhizobium meliloti]
MSEYLQTSKSADASAQRTVEGYVKLPRLQVSRAASSNPSSDQKRAA